MNEVNLEFNKWRDDCFEAMNQVEKKGQKDIMKEITREITMKVTFIERLADKIADETLKDAKDPNFIKGFGEYVKAELKADHVEVSKIKDFVMDVRKGSKK